MSCCVWMGAHVLVLMAAAALTRAIRWRKGPHTPTAQAWRLSHDRTHTSDPRHHSNPHTQP